MAGRAQGDVGVYGNLIDGISLRRCFCAVKAARRRRRSSFRSIYEILGNDKPTFANAAENDLSALGYGVGAVLVDDNFRLLVLSGAVLPSTLDAAGYGDDQSLDRAAGAIGQLAVSIHAQGDIPGHGELDGGTGHSVIADNIVHGNTQLRFTDHIVALFGGIGQTVYKDGDFVAHLQGVHSGRWSHQCRQPSLPCSWPRTGPCR